MARLILFVFLLAGALFAIAGLVLVLRLISPQHGSSWGAVETMPQTVRTVAYVLLILLMFGVVTGWLGAA